MCFLLVGGGTSMYYYKLFAGAPEGSCMTPVIHEQKFSDEELTALLAGVLMKAGQQCSEAERARYVDWSQDPDLAEERRAMWAEYASQEYKPEVEEVWYEAVELLCKEHGFQRLTYSAVTNDIGAWDTCWPEFKRFGQP